MSIARDLGFSEIMASKHLMQTTMTMNTRYSAAFKTSTVSYTSYRKYINPGTPPGSHVPLFRRLLHNHSEMEGISSNSFNIS